MRLLHLAVRCSFLGLLLAARLNAQALPNDATLEELAVAFMTQTASSAENVNRPAFASRLAGALSGISPLQFRGMLQGIGDIRIDTLLPARAAEGELRTAAYVTALIDGESQNLYLFFVCDSIWRLEGVRRFPSAGQRKQILESLSELDTVTPYQRTLRADLERLLLPDDSLGARLAGELDHARKLVEPLLQGKLWRRFLLRETRVADADEYRELDDDIPADQLIFYKLNREAVERLRVGTGIVWIERDDRFPDLLFMVGGSIGDDTYGYIYSPTPSALPLTSVDEFIMVRPVAGNWWLYKKTGG